MRFDDAFYARNRDGSTDLGGGDAHILTQGAGPIARTPQGIVRFPLDLPAIVYGGAGSGKYAQLGAYQLVHPSTRSFFALDISGQMMSTTWHDNLAMGREAYAINPHGVGLYPDINHPVHLFHILKEDELLFDKARAISDMALSQSERDGENAWVGQDAMRWLTRILTSLVRLEGTVTPKRKWQLINRLDADDEFLKAWGRACEGLPNDEYETFLEIYRKKQTSEKEYGAVMGKLKSDLDWLSSKNVADTISGDAPYLSYLGDPEQKVGIYFVLRGGTTKENESLIRMVVGIAQLNCVYANEGALPLFYLEECASVGKADFIKKAASEFRKYFRTVFIYQSRGQVELLFGQSGAQEIEESCAVQIYLGGGIRNIKSAKSIADAVGKKTILYDTPLTQADRAFQADSASWHAYWRDMDFMDAARTIEHEAAQSRQQRQYGRYAIDPAELMRLKHEVLILAPGMGVQPVLAAKMPCYWDNPAMAGRYGPDPLFPPLSRVKIKRRFLWGHKHQRFIRREVPAHLAHWPNHINGEITYVQGYRTW